MYFRTSVSLLSTRPLGLSSFLGKKKLRHTKIEWSPGAGTELILALLANRQRKGPCAHVNNMEQTIYTECWLPLTEIYDLQYNWGFPGSWASKESTCQEGDPSSISGSGRSTGEGMGYPLQYSWASLVAQLVKNPPAMQETWVRSLGWKDPLEKETATYSGIMAWRILWTVQSISWIIAL